ncbi:helix-turn-helix domain-containing protein [Streptomyces thinghirensis]|nr:helix-turn-helix domain-containing protein [Streptomyces thinghirensis]
MSVVKYAELGAFLRSRRSASARPTSGSRPGRWRRVPGLRREEVAQLAGASVDYYNELERGAGSQPSEQMIAALARALRLSADERDYLYRLADRPVPVQGGCLARPPRHARPARADDLDPGAGDHRPARHPRTESAGRGAGRGPVRAPGAPGPASCTGGSPSPTPGACIPRPTTRGSPAPRRRPAARRRGGTPRTRRPGP